jgi:hypothetical protein
VTRDECDDCRLLQLKMSRKFPPYFQDLEESANKNCYREKLDKLGGVVDPCGDVALLSRGTQHADTAIDTSVYQTESVL